MSYYRDYRVYAALKDKWYKDYNESNMTVRVSFEGHDDLEFEVDEDCCVTFPMRFTVCITCGGKGKHVNPSIDSHGITSDEWEQEWSNEERQMYIGGFYDVDCYECGGMRVVPDISMDELTEEMGLAIRLIDEMIIKSAREARDRARELEMGY